MKIIHLRKVDSTQEYLKRILKEFKDEEIFIFADIQTKGKGRFKNKFFSPEGGIYLSFYLPDVKENKRAFLLTCVSVFSVIEETTKEYNLNPYIRIPNDIMIEKKKICGILIEKINDNFINGIGINVNTQNFPEGLNSAGSLYLFTGKKFNIDDLKEKLVNKILEFNKKDSEFLYEIYRKNIPLNVKIEFMYENRNYKGILKNLKDNFTIEVITEEDIKYFPLFEIFDFRIRDEQGNLP